MTAAAWFTVAAAFAWGVVFGVLFAQRLLQPKQFPAPSKQGDEPREIVVKRTVPSFRHPSQTTVDRYERYRASSGLYAPVRPGKGSTAEEVDK